MVREGIGGLNLRAEYIYMDCDNMRPAEGLAPLGGPTSDTGGRGAGRAKRRPGSGRWPLRRKLGRQGRGNWWWGGEGAGGGDFLTGGHVASAVGREGRKIRQPPPNISWAPSATTRVVRLETLRPHHGASNVPAEGRAALVFRQFPRRKS